MEYAENRPVLGQEDAVRPKVKDSAKVRSEKIRIEQHSATGMLWFGGWLFSIGFLHLTFWKAVLGLLIWPYYIGVTVAASLAR
jgi:hypothetical protein